MGNTKEKLEQLIFKVLNKLTKKEEKYIIFESANFIFDNSYSLYKYIKANYPQYKFKYVMTNKEQVKCASGCGISKKEILKKSSNPFSVISLIKYSLKAKAMFFSYTNYWNKFDYGNKPIVYLPHGEFPIKNVDSYLSEMFRIGNNNWFLYPTQKNYELHLKAYPILEKINALVSGLPRNDDIYDHSLSKERLFKTLNFEGKEDTSLVLFMPTFRTNDDPNTVYFKDEFPISINEEQLDDLNEFAKQNNMLLLFKLHHAQALAHLPQKELSNIRYINNIPMQRENFSNQMIYQIADTLLTDFSTAYMSYLLLDRKVAFMLGDMEDYYKKRGYTISNLIDYLPGDKIHNYDELKDYLSHFRDINDPYKEERKKVLDIFTGDYGPNNCKLVADHFLKEENK